MIKRVLLCVLFYTYAVTGAANELEEAFAKLNLSPNKSVSGQFEQAKKITVLKNELSSSGSFQADENGFVWQQLLPVKSQISLQNNTVISRDNLGNEKNLAQAQQYIPLLQALLTQDAAKLDTYLSFAALDGQCISFIPKAPLNTLYKSISLCGENQVNQLILIEQANHQTRISLTYDKHHSA